MTHGRSATDPPVLAEARFTCSLCGQPAGSIRALADPPRIRIERDGNTYMIGPDDLPAFQAAAAQPGARALYRLDLEYTPTYCPDCDAVYCRAHWQTWLEFDADEPSWLDCVRGTCPKGHTRMIED